MGDTTIDEAIEPRVADHEGFALQRLSAAETPQRVSEAENGVSLEPAVNVQQDDRDKSTPKSQSHDETRETPADSYVNYAMDLSCSSITLPVRLEERAPSSSVIRENPGLSRVSVDEDGEGGNAKGSNSVNVAAGLGIACPSFRRRMEQRERHRNNTPQPPRSVRSYYRKMDEILSMYADETNKAKLRDEVEGDDKSKRTSRDNTDVLAKVSFFTNLALLILKTVAAALSGSLSVISSLVDSIMDLVSGIIIWLTSSAMKKRLPYDYPSGRTRLEPVAIVILSAIMSVASVQLVAESIQSIISIAKDQLPAIDFDNVTIGVLSATMLAKWILWVLCRGSDSPSIQALSLDHRNDILANMVASVCGYVGQKYWAYLDPIGAILIGVYIMYNWWGTGAEQIKLLTGYTADPEFLSKVTWVSMQHDLRIKQIDTVRAYHFGNNYIVEVHIVLPEDMSLKEAHDIGEPLQRKLEALDKVERAFVHVDYESEHDPQTEHKVT